MSDPGSAAADPVRRILSSPEDVDLPEGLRQIGGSPGDEGSDNGAPPSGPPYDGTASEERPPPPEAQAALCPLNDIGNGRRFAIYHGEDVLRVPRVGWFTWDGTKWASDPDDLAVRTRAQQVSERMLAEIPHLVLDSREKKALADLPLAKADLRRLEALADPTPEDRAALAQAETRLRTGEAVRRYLDKRQSDYRTFAKSTGNTGKIDAMLREGEVGLSHPLAEMDALPLLVNTLSGTLRFAVAPPPPGQTCPVASYDLAPHDRGDLLTKCMPVHHDPEAEAPGFHAFLSRIQPDPELRGFLKRSFGLAMTSIVVQRMWFFHGAGANGKSVLVDLMARMLGDYAATAKIESLTGQSKRGGGDATPDLVPLMGARLVRASEPEQGERLKEGTIKELTGGEPILVRALHSDFVEVYPQFKLMITGNHKPEIRGTDDGIWRRVMLVPFGVQIPEAERDPHLTRKLFAEAPGILNWMIEGLVDFLELGLQVPKTVLEATQEYREDSDPIGSFLDQCCEVTGQPETFIRTKELVEAVNYWLDERGDSMWQPRTIQLKLKSYADRWRDPRNGRTFGAAKRSIAGYQGLTLTEMFRHRWDEARRESSTRGTSRPSAPNPDFDI